ncbi:NUDIX hydrolase [Patescibacteria group bacterium]|nr:NUDIX hydrolase [Patescibacteria group bacterium]
MRGLLYQMSNNGVLLLRRHSNAHFSPGMWELPGGKFDKDSMSMDQAIEREFGEETGIPIVATQPPPLRLGQACRPPSQVPGRCDLPVHRVKSAPCLSRSTGSSSFQ